MWGTVLLVTTAWYASLHCFPEKSPMQHVCCTFDPNFNPVLEFVAARDKNLKQK